MAALQQLWSLRHRRPWFVAGSLLVLVFLLMYPAFHWWLQAIDISSGFRFFDMGAYRQAVRHWQAGEPLYIRNEDGGFHGSYLYPPIYVLLFWPFESVSFRTAGVVWNAISIGLLWLGLQAMIGGYDVRLEWYERGLLLWAILGYYPVILSARLAQVSVFLAGILSIALATLIYAERDTAHATHLHAVSGVATAVGGTVKLIYAPVGAHLLQDRRRFGAAIVTGVVLLVASVAIFGIDAHRGYLDVLMWGKGWGESRHPSLWLPGYYRPMYVFGAAGIWLQFVLAGFITVVAVDTAKEEVDVETFALGVAAVPLLAPRAYTQDLALFLPVVVVLLAGELRRGSAGRPLIPVIGVWLAAIHSYTLYGIVNVLPPRLPYGEILITLSPVLQPGAWGTVLLVGLAAWRVSETGSRAATLFSS